MTLQARFVHMALSSVGMSDKSPTPSVFKDETEMGAGRYKQVFYLWIYVGGTIDSFFVHQPQPKPTMSETRSATKASKIRERTNLMLASSNISMRRAKSYAWLVHLAMLNSSF